MGDENSECAIQKPTTLELRHSNNIMIDKTVIIQSSLDAANDNDASAASSMVVCSTLSDATTTSADGCAMTQSEQDLLNGNDSIPAIDAQHTPALIQNDPDDNEADNSKDGVGDETPTDEDDPTKSPDADQPCAMFGQMIDHDDETWELLSDAASWESSFPKAMLSDYENQVASPSVDSDTADLPPGWKKVCDSSGSYYWNIESGQTQSDHPDSNINSEESKSDLTSTQSTDTIKAAAGDGQQNKPAELQGKKDQNRWSGNSRDGHLFLVRSLGWLPVEHENLKPDVSSAAVNSCIRLLSSNRSQIMDGIGVWGEGKDLMLLLNEDHLKIVDPLENTVLQSQSIRHIRVWGVGRDSMHDFAYVVRDPTTKVYKCHVFRCDAPAHSIAKQLHTICSLLVARKKLTSQKGAQSGELLTADNADEMPALTTEQCQTFPSNYMGSIKVLKPSGINVLKQAIHEVMKDADGNGASVKVCVSPSALTVSDGSSEFLVNCRMRCLSFMGVGDDIQVFGFISVLGGEATCHVLHCTPNAAKLAVAVQEACMLRYQKAIDSTGKQPVKNANEPPPNKSLKSKVFKLFSGWRSSRS